MAAARKDYYAVLGVDRNADTKEIKRACKRLAMRNHPDVNKDPGAKVPCTFVCFPLVAPMLARQRAASTAIRTLRHAMSKKAQAG